MAVRLVMAQEEVKPALAERCGVAIAARRTGLVDSRRPPVFPGNGPGENAPDKTPDTRRKTVEWEKETIGQSASHPYTAPSQRGWQGMYKEASPCLPLRDSPHERWCRHPGVASRGATGPAGLQGNATRDDKAGPEAYLGERASRRARSKQIEVDRERVEISHSLR